MIGDFLREAAVLVIVFYPLDRYLHDVEYPADATKTLPVHQIIELSLLLLATGIVLEKVDFGAIVVRVIDGSIAGLLWCRETLRRTGS